MRRVAPQLPPHTVSLVFSQINTRGDGRVSFGDFHAMMSARPDGRVAAMPIEAPASRAAGMPAAGHLVHMAAATSDVAGPRARAPIRVPAV